MWRLRVVPWQISNRSWYRRLYGVTFVWPSDADRSGVRSYTITKKPFIYISWVIWSPEFEWWMPVPSNSVAYPLTDVFSRLMSRLRLSLGICRSHTWWSWSDRNGGSYTGLSLSNREIRCSLPWWKSDVSGERPTLRYWWIGLGGYRQMWKSWVRLSSSYRGHGFPCLASHYERQLGV